MNLIPWFITHSLMNTFFLRHGRKKVRNNVSQQYIKFHNLEHFSFINVWISIQSFTEWVIYNVWVYPFFFPFIILFLFSLNSLASIQTNTKLLWIDSLANNSRNCWFLWLKYLCSNWYATKVDSKYFLFAFGVSLFLIQ